MSDLLAIFSSIPQTLHQWSVFLQKYSAELYVCYTTPQNFAYICRAIWQIVGVALGIGASAVTFRVPAKELIWATAAGFLGWEVMYCLQFYEVQTLLATTLGSLTVSICGEIFARDRKAPAPIYVVPGIIPLVPGRAIYNAMFSSLKGDYDASGSGAMQALLGAGGIAVGMLIGTAIARGIMHPQHRRRIALERELHRHLHSLQYLVSKQHIAAQKKAEAERKAKLEQRLNIIRRVLSDSPIQEEKSEKDLQLDSPQPRSADELYPELRSKPKVVTARPYPLPPKAQRRHRISMHKKHR